MPGKTSEKPDLRRGGRPSRQQAGQIEERIVDCAAELFLTQGYAVTSIESIAQKAGVSKRTFYHRFDDKAAIFAAVVKRLVTRLRPKDESHLFSGNSLPALLLQLAKLILHASLTPEAVSMQRLLMCEAGRMPELSDILSAQGARQEAIKRIAGLLQREKNKGHIAVDNPSFAAEQFLQMVTASPLRRAMGMAPPLSKTELDEWAQRSVELFLHGCKLKTHDLK